MSRYSSYYSSSELMLRALRTFRFLLGLALLMSPASLSSVLSSSEIETCELGSRLAIPNTSPSLTLLSISVSDPRASDPKSIVLLVARFFLGPTLRVPFSGRLPSSARRAIRSRNSFSFSKNSLSASSSSSESSILTALFIMARFSKSASRRFSLLASISASSTALRFRFLLGFRGLSVDSESLELESEDSSESPYDSFRTTLRRIRSAPVLPSSNEGGSSMYCFRSRRLISRSSAVTSSGMTQNASKSSTVSVTLRRRTSLPEALCSHKLQEQLKFAVFEYCCREIRISKFQILTSQK